MQCVAVCHWPISTLARSWIHNSTCCNSLRPACCSISQCAVVCYLQIWIFARTLICRSCICESFKSACAMAISCTALSSSPSTPWWSKTKSVLCVCCGNQKLRSIMFRVVAISKIGESKKMCDGVVAISGINLSSSPIKHWWIGINQGYAYAKNKSTIGICV